MNKRIQEIAQLAGIETELDEHGEVKLSTAYGSSLEYFAQLIAQECMDLCSKVEEDDELSDYTGGFRDGALLCQQEIKEHFGVKVAQNKLSP